MIQASYTKHIFKFNFPGGTSRGVLHEKPSWFIKIWDEIAPELTGIGEVSIIPGLSLENESSIEVELKKLLANPLEYLLNREENLKSFPAIKFGLETALLDMQNGAKRNIYPSEFTQGKQGITINGLVWMGKKQEMLDRIQEKVNSGFKCIKIKVGAIDFNEEIELLKFIRKSYNKNILELRVDANGAFDLKTVHQKLDELAKYDIHSIEQPIKAGNWKQMAKLCKTSPLAIALDEELIGVCEKDDRKELLNSIAPQYIVLKPSLLGGFNDAEQWASLAEQNNIAWWATSALEGNIGLNAIAQWTFKYGQNLPQGLGTGQVYSNNIASPLEIRGEELWHNSNSHWGEI